jgi:hypothetical protein
VADRYRHYDVLAKRDTMSWNDKTREVIAERLSLRVSEGVLTTTQLATLQRLVQRVCPDPPGRPTTTFAMIVEKIGSEESDGFRHHLLPPAAECWRRGLDAIEAEARQRHDRAFALLDGAECDRILRDIERGQVQSNAWAGLPPDIFWLWRVLPDGVSAHWAQPALWSAMGFGGPASPRGYVRMGIDRRDPWEAVEEGEPLEGLPRHRAG